MTSSQNTSTAKSPEAPRQALEMTTAEIVYDKSGTRSVEGRVALPIADEPEHSGNDRAVGN